MRTSLIAQCGRGQQGTVVVAKVDRACINQRAEIVLTEVIQWQQCFVKRCEEVVSDNCMKVDGE